LSVGRWALSIRCSAFKGVNGLAAAS